jgi:hypothetical protein
LTVMRLSKNHTTSPVPGGNVNRDDSTVVMFFSF